MLKRGMRVLDAIYETTGSDEEWLSNLLARAAPLLDDGSGVQACRVHFGEPPSVSGPILVGGEPAWQAVWREHWWRDVVLAIEPDTLCQMVGFGAVSVTHQLFAAIAARIDTFAELLTRLDDEGYRHALARQRHAHTKLFYPDSVNVFGVDASGHGVAIIANRRAPLAARLPRRRMLSNLAAHLAAGARLRRRLSGSDATVGAEAVMSGDGRLLHAEGPAKTASGRDALARAAGVLGSASRTVTDDEALSLWRALQAGRWSIVERFESDGRRILVARENLPRVAPAIAALSVRERQVLAELACGHSNKEIGYRLGLAPSTVATHLQGAAGKLGVSSPRELVTHARRIMAEAHRED